MPKVRIESILDGQSSYQGFANNGQFQASLGIDPDKIASTSDYKPSGFIRPSALEKFSASEITGVPLWFVSNPKNDSTYLYANDGKVHVVANDLTSMGTALNSGTALTSSSANGAAYYDNYIYFAKNADVARYGPLNGSASLTQNYWTSTLSLTAPTDTTYPSINGVEIPNHAMFRHSDDKLYFCDVTGGNNGILSYVKTTKSSVEGDTNDTSTYNALDFDSGVYPVSISYLDTNLAIALIEGTDTSTKQMRSSVAFWDTTSSSFQKVAFLHDPIITALHNVNGSLYVFSGDALGNCRVSVYVGGDTFQQVKFLPGVFPPFQGAVDSFLNKIFFGGNSTDIKSGSNAYGCVYSIGLIGPGSGTSLHTPLVSTGTPPAHVTALKLLRQDGVSSVSPLVGWKASSTYGLDTASNTYQTHVFRSELFRVGRPFRLKKIRIPFNSAITTNQTCTVTVSADNQTAVTFDRAINSTAYANSERAVDLHDNVIGQNDFYIDITLSGTALMVVKLPIEIEFEYLDQNG